MNGFWNRRVWMWVVTIPALILGALAAAGDSLEIAGRLWWLSAPVLGGLAVAYWYALGPAEKPPPGAPRPPLTAFDVGMRLVGIVVLLALTVIGLGLVVAFVMWLRPYWLIIGPVYLAFALWVAWGFAKDELARRKARREAQIVR